MIQLVRKPPKVLATSAFITSEGRFKCAGALSALDFNPFPIENCPPFRVSMNGEWREVQLCDAHPSVGWIAEGVESLRGDLDVTPKVELRQAARS